MAIRRVIFLDIDGVLLTRPYLRGLIAAGGPVDRTRVDPDKVALLNGLGDVPEVGVVVSSSWRDDPATPAVLAGQGLALPFHEDWATTSDVPDRGITKAIRDWQVQCWLARHQEVVAYAIADDEAAFNGERSRRLARTTMEEGLTPVHVARMRGALLRPLRGNRPQPSGLPGAELAQGLVGGGADTEDPVHGREP